MSRTLELAFLHADACSFSAAMAASEDEAIDKLKAGQRVFEASCKMFGGRIVNIVGDSILLAFDSAQAAFQTARHSLETNATAGNSETRPFDYRIGITMGRVTVRDNSLYGHCINMAARIGSLVGRNNIGVERSAWSSVLPITQSKRAKERILFAKPDEPFVDFFEVGMPGNDTTRLDIGASTRNEPVILLLPQYHGVSNQHSKQNNEILDAFNWNCTSYFSTYGWQTAVLDRKSGSQSVVEESADYILRCHAINLPAGFRLFASVSSRYFRNGTQSLTRDARNFDGAIAHASALASLVGSAISHAELERAARTQAAGSHQLVAAGRACIDGFNQEQFATGMRYLAAAQKIDPEYPLLLSTLARAYTVGWRFGWKEEGIDLLGTARGFANEAVRRAPTDARCEADLGFAKFWANEATESAWHYERSIDTLPYHPELSADAGMVFSYVGEFDKAVGVLERSVANLPVDADYRLWSLGDVYFANHDYKNSLKWLSRMNDQTQAQRLMAANKARLGLDPSQHVANVLLQQPDFSVRHWVNIQPFTNEADREDFQEALLLAGLPP